MNESGTVSFAQLKRKFEWNGSKGLNGNENKIVEYKHLNSNSVPEVVKKSASIRTFFAAFCISTSLSIYISLSFFLIMTSSWLHLLEFGANNRLNFVLLNGNCRFIRSLKGVSSICPSPLIRFNLHFWLWNRTFHFIWNSFIHTFGCPGRMMIYVKL